jgi:hypothetical protein
MTIASRTELMQMRYTRMGMPFCNIGASSTINQNGQTSEGSPFLPFVAEITPPVYSYNRYPVQFGAPFLNIVANGTSDASVNEFNRRGSPYYVPGTGGGPVVIYKASQFFVMF